MRKNIRFVISLLFLLFSFLHLWSQPHPEFIQVGTENGISNNSATSIAQDSLGFIWIGTKHGLNKYDGIRFKQYTQNKHNIPESDISVLMIDNNNRFWVGTYNDGLFRYDYFRDRFEQIPFSDNSIVNNIEIHALIEDKQGWIWVATNDGLYSYDQFGKLKHYKQEGDTSVKNDIWAIVEAPDNKLWIGTFGSGIYTFDKKTGKFANPNFSFFSGLSIDSDYVNTLFVEKSGNLLVGTNGKGLKHIDFQKKRISNYLTKTEYENISIVRCIWQDSMNNLWIGTDGDGVLQIKSRSGQISDIKNYRNNDENQFSLPSNTINSFFKDRQSNLWIATAKRGVCVLKQQSPEIEFYYSDAKGKYSTSVLSVFKDKNGLWIGTDGEGLTLLKDKDSTADFFTKSTDRFVGDFVQCIEPTGDGSYWIGTYAQGLYHYNTKTRKAQNFIHKPDATFSIDHNNIRDIHVLPSGDLWIATWGEGLVYFDLKKQITKTFKNELQNSESLGNNNVLAICPDRSGRLWLATYGGGLSIYDPMTKKFKNFRAENNSGLNSNYIFSLLLDEDKTLWLGTKEGLCQLNLQTLKFKNIPIDVTDSQQSTIVSLLQDNEGNIWAGTQKGIMRIQKDSHKTDFIPDIYDNFNFNSAFQDEDGKMFFGGNKQVVAFYPSDIKFNTFSAPTYFTDFKLFNKSIPVDSNGILKKQICFENQIDLNYNQSVITVEYATLQYPFAENIAYELKLEGLEDEWHNVGNQSAVTFSNLSPGKYTLLVRPVIAQSHPDIASTSIHINVRPPFWHTWWAYLIYLFLILGILYAYRRYTLKWAKIKNELNLEKFKREQEEHVFQLKEHFFTNISHDIRTPLTLIAGSINKLFSNNNADLAEQKDFNTIRTNTNRLLNLTEELLNFRKLETGNITLKVVRENIVEFTKEIYISYKQLAVNKSIKYEFETSQPEILVWIDRFQFERAIYNLISNAFKYTSDGGSIKVGIYLTNTKVEIKIIDTGRGISPDDINHIFEHFYQADSKSQSYGFGVGLSITQEIIHLHGGDISVSSKIGQGSEFTILLHLGKEHLNNVEFIYTPNETDRLSKYITNNNTAISSENVLDNNDKNKEYSVLIVEDNPDIRIYLTEILSPWYSVYEAANGQEGLHKAIELFPDIIISDIMMPVMDGITLCSKLKTDMRTSHIPIILLTARTLTSSIIEGLETGADDYLTKPFDEKILLLRVDNLLQNRKRIREYISKEIIIKPEEINLNSQDNIFLSNLVDYIEKHIDEPELNIGQMASMMGMSHSNLYKKVKALTGETVIGFIKDFRLKRAAQLLVKDQHYIKEIAYMVGYSDRRHFSDDFKKKFNLTPKEYMEKYKELTSNKLDINKS